MTGVPDDVRVIAEATALRMLGQGPRENAKLIAYAILADRAARSSLAPTEDEQVPFSQSEQGARCACRGFDDYCCCQNVPDRKTLTDFRAVRARQPKPQRREPA